jgi:acyl-[acyl carrier protein]--UDP-N-acetylglucosamine O-acyltransferase
MSQAWIDPRAVVHDDAVLGADVVIGPFCVIGAGVSIGDRTRLESHVVLDGKLTLGADCTVAPFASLGGAPQDLKYKGEPTAVEIGAGNHIKEYVTISRGTVGGSGIRRRRQSLRKLRTSAIAGRQQDHLRQRGHAGWPRRGRRRRDGRRFVRRPSVLPDRHTPSSAAIAVTQDACRRSSPPRNRATSHGVNIVGLKRKGIRPRPSRRSSGAT